MAFFFTANYFFFSQLLVTLTYLVCVVPFVLCLEVQ